MYIRHNVAYPWLYILLQWRKSLCYKIHVYPYVRWKLQPHYQSAHFVHATALLPVPQESPEKTFTRPPFHSWITCINTHDAVSWRGLKLRSMWPPLKRKNANYLHEDGLCRGIPRLELVYTLHTVTYITKSRQYTPSYMASTSCNVYWLHQLKGMCR